MNQQIKKIILGIQFVFSVTELTGVSPTIIDTVTKCTLIILGLQFVFSLTELTGTSLTIIDTVTKRTLVPPAPLNELHERTHVSFAAVAANGAALPMVDEIKRCL